MRVLVAAGLFLVASVAIVGLAAIAVGFGATPVAGIVFIVLWAVTAVVLSRIASGPDRSNHQVRWAVLGALFGPFPAAWLAWRASERLAPLIGRHA